MDLENRFSEILEQNAIIPPHDLTKVCERLKVLARVCLPRQQYDFTATPPQSGVTGVPLGYNAIGRFYMDEHFYDQWISNEGESVHLNLTLESHTENKVYIVQTYTVAGGCTEFWVTLDADGTPCRIEVKDDDTNTHAFYIGTIAFTRVFSWHRLLHAEFLILKFGNFARGDKSKCKYALKLHQATKAILIAANKTTPRLPLELWLMMIEYFMGMACITSDLFSKEIKLLL